MKLAVITVVLSLVSIAYPYVTYPRSEADAQEIPVGAGYPFDAERVKAQGPKSPEVKVQNILRDCADEYCISQGK